MKYLVITALAAFTAGVTSCGVAKGLAESVSRTTSTVGRTVGNLGSSLSR